MDRPQGNAGERRREPDECVLRGRTGDATRPGDGSQRSRRLGKRVRGGGGGPRTDETTPRGPRRVLRVACGGGFAGV